MAKRDQRLNKYRENVDYIIENKVTDEEYIEAAFEQIMDYYDDFLNTLYHDINNYHKIYN